MVRPYSKILVAGCDTCTAESLSGGRKQVAELAAALETMAVLPVERAERTLTAAVRDEESSVRIAACQAWGRRGGPAALEGQQYFLCDPHFCCLGLSYGWSQRYFIFPGTSNDSLP